MTALDSPNPSSSPRNALAAWMENNRFLLRRLHSLTGVIFGGYIVVHLLVNATLLETQLPFLFGGEAGNVYQNQVNKIHDLPFLIVIELVAIIFPILFHAIYGTMIVVAGRPNVSNYGYAKNWAYFWQRVTSIVLLAFIAFHVMSMKGMLPGSFGNALTFVPKQYATESTINHMQAAWWVGWVVYPVGILAATFHLANGFWTAAVTWGLTIGAKSQKLWGYACVGLFLFTFACGMGTLLATLVQEPYFDDPKVVKAQEEGYEAVAGYAELLDSDEAPPTDADADATNAGGA
ncbi:MAG: hypothetical protein AAGK78_02315 [Planctomycetota bacterium]